MFPHVVPTTFGQLHRGGVFFFPAGLPLTDDGVHRGAARANNPDNLHPHPLRRPVHHSKRRPTVVAWSSPRRRYVRARVAASVPYLALPRLTSLSPIPVFELCQALVNVLTHYRGWDNPFRDLGLGANNKRRQPDHSKVYM